MKTILIFSLIFLPLVMVAQLDTITWELYYQDDGTIPGYPTGFKTYRIYAHTVDANDRVVSINNNHDNSSSECVLGSSNNRIWNNQSACMLEYPGSWADTLSYESMDSYITIGNTLEHGMQTSPLWAMAYPPIAIMNSFAVESFTLDSICRNFRLKDYLSDLVYNVFGQQTNANWLMFSLQAQPQHPCAVPQPPDNRVLIAQITTDGEPLYSINLSVYDDVSNTSIFYVHDPMSWQTDGSTLGLCYPPGSCNAYFGCTNPLACNYDIDALTDNALCVFGADCNGCTHSDAVNYDPDAEIEDGSCFYNIGFQFYYDYNLDGMNTVGEPLIESGIQGTLLASGEISDLINPFLKFNGVTTGTNVVALSSNGSEQFDFEFGSDFVFNVADQYLFNLTSNPNYTYDGVIDELGLFPRLYGRIPVLAPDTFFTGNVEVYIPNFLCNQISNHTLSMLNQSTDSVNVKTVLSIDPLYQSIINVAGADSIVGQLIYFSFDSLAPGEMVNEVFQLLSPLPDFAGSDVVITSNTVGYDLGGNQVFELLNEATHIVSCSYDPNTKSAVPVGYSTQHFVLAGSELEYVIDFQNIGNGVAYNVMIEDSLDHDRLDFTTFQITSASHDFELNVLSDGTLQFFFNDIFLADSASDEPASHGHISFKIHIRDNLPVFSTIKNIATIQFDNNPAIITNEVIHQIFDCSVMQNENDSLVDCVNSTLELSMTQSYIEDYSWIVDGELMEETSSELDLMLESPGIHQVIGVGTNPFCEVRDTVIISLEETPLYELSFDLFTGVITIPDLQAGSNVIWYSSGQFFENFGSDTLHVLDVIEFQSAFEIYAVIHSSSGCVSTTPSVVWTDVTEINHVGMKVFPNPASYFAMLIIPQGYWHLEVFDVTGRLLFSENFKGSTYNLPLESIQTTGFIQLKCSEESGRVFIEKLVIN